MFHITLIYFKKYKEFKVQQLDKKYHHIEFDIITRSDGKISCTLS